MFELICDDWSIIKIIEEELFDMRKIYKINRTYKHINTWILNLKTYFSYSIWQCKRCFTLLGTKDKKVINTWNKNGELAPEDILCRYILIQKFRSSNHRWSLHTKKECNIQATYVYRENLLNRKMINQPRKSKRYERSS